MNTTEILQKLKQTFNDLVNVQPVAPVQLMEATLKDGTKVEITEMAVGGIVTINGTPAPVGEHELSDGTYIVVGENGAIMEIKKEEETPSVDMTAQFSAMESAFNEKFATLENKIASYETKIEATNKFISELFEFTKTLAEMPTGTPDVAVKTDNQFVEAKKKDYSILFN
jgi:hypothetical protein